MLLRRRWGENNFGPGNWRWSVLHRGTSGHRKGEDHTPSWEEFSLKIWGIVTGSGGGGRLGAFADEGGIYKWVSTNCTYTYWGILKLCQEF